MNLQIPDLEPMFQPGARYRIDFGDGHPNEEAVVEVRGADRLHLVTGQLVACDPFWASAYDSDTAAFTVAVAPGRYPVELSVARVDQPANPRLPAPWRLGAAAKIIIRDEPVATWELALRPGENLAGLRAGKFYGFGVTHGIGAFLDASALAILAPLGEPGPEQGQDPELNNVLPELQEKLIVNVTLDQSADRNVIVFSAGMGGDAYRVWIGRTAAGLPACFVADLKVLSQFSSELISG